MVWQGRVGDHSPYAYSGEDYFLTTYFPKITVLEKWELAAM